MYEEVTIDNNLMVDIAVLGSSHMQATDESKSTIDIAPEIAKYFRKKVPNHHFGYFELTMIAVNLVI